MSNPFDSNNSYPDRENWGQELYGKPNPGQPNEQHDGYHNAYGQQPYGSAEYEEQGYGQQAYGQQGYPNAQQYNNIPAPGANGTFDAMDSIGQAWKVFAERPVAWIVPSLIYFGIFIVLYLSGLLPFIGYMSANSDENGNLTGPMNPGVIIWFVLALGISIISMILWQMVMYRIAAQAIGGYRPEIRDFFTYKRVGIIFVTSIVVGLLTMLGMIVFIVGYLVVAFFLSYAVIASAMPGMTVGSALSSSYEVAKRNAVQTLVLLVLLAIINGIAGATGIGVLVSVPLAALATAHAYMTATNREVQRRA